ncbi:MAG: SIR2 family protein [Ignavibacteria bacterium]|nr:SIR2 family protein [Ignavibacteria bacterium]
MSLEVIANIVQKYVSNTNPVLVLGTGASIPYGLPSMPTLATELTRKIAFPSDDENYVEWQKFCNELDKTGDLEKSLNNVELNASIENRIINETWQYINGKDLLLHDRLLQDKAKSSLIPLIKYFCRTSSTFINIITTNYDRLIEYSCALSAAYVSTGFTPGYMGRFISPFDYKHNKNTFGSEIHVNLCKVHGSLDWFYDLNTIPISVPLSKEIPSGFRPIIITPGSLKYRRTHQEPFRSIMSTSDDMINNSNVIIAIGFGFNDEHVEPKIMHRVRNDSIPIIVVTKQLTEATKQKFLNASCNKFLLFEEAAPNSTKVYSNSNLAGEILTDMNLWTVEGFNSLIIDEKV